MSYEKCFKSLDSKDNCPEFRVVETLMYTREGEPDGIAPEPGCNIYPKCIYRTRRAVSCRNRNKVCEGHGLPCSKCPGFEPIRRVWIG